MKPVIVSRRDCCYWVEIVALPQMEMGLAPESSRMDLIAAALQRHYHSPAAAAVASEVVQMETALVRWELQKDLLSVAAAVPQTRCCFVVG